MTRAHAKGQSAEQDPIWLNFGGELLTFSRGEYLFSQGIPVENMYFVQSGRVKLLRYTPEGDRVILHAAVAGELVAEASLFADHYHCSAKTDQPSRIYRLDRRQILQTLSTRADISMQVLQALSQQIRDLRGLLEIRNIRSAEQRVLAYLRSLTSQESEIELALSLRDTAHKLGLAHETLYRSLKKLEDQGLIERPQARTIILRQ